MGNAEERGRGKKSFTNSAILPNPTPTQRVFCAIELPLEIRERLIEHIKLLRESVPEVRASWERLEKLHLTLKFLGEIARDRIGMLSDAAGRAARRTRPFTLALADAGMFPPRGVPRILWIGINDLSGALGELQHHLEDEGESAGFAREARPFHPHVTIARVRSPQGAPKLSELHQKLGFESIKFPVQEIVVMKSDLGPGGSSYTELSRHKFKAEVDEPEASDG